MASAVLEAGAARSWRTGRVWHRVPREPLPPIEAGRAHLAALLNGPDGPRADLKTSADDRAETSMKAVLRVLWRRGHAERSGAYATTQDQLVDALMPVMGWKDKGSVTANRSAHGRSVRRWLDRLQAMGVLEWNGVRDNQGRWWRIELRLIRPPDPDPDALRVARRRARTFSRRERRRRTSNPDRRRDLGHVLARSQRPSRSARRRRARSRAQAVHGARVARSAARCDAGRCDAARCDELKVRSNPFGAPPPVEEINGHVASSFETAQSYDTVTARTGARACGLEAHPPNPQVDDRPTARHLSEGSGTAQYGNVSIESARPDRPGETPEAVEARVAATERLIATGQLPPTKWHVIAATRERAFAALAEWPAGRRIPDRVLLAAFEHAIGTTAVPLPRDGSHRPALERALDRYSRYGAHRPTAPDGTAWPQSPAAALARVMRDLDGHTARDGEPPRSPLYAIGRLNLVAKQMAAESKRAAHADEVDARRRRRLARRERRDAPFSFRTGQPAWRSRPFEASGVSEWKRRAAIDAALAGELPGFEALHGFLIRASDLLGRPNPQRRLWGGVLAYREALDALDHAADFLAPDANAVDATGGDDAAPPTPEVGER